MPSNAPKLAMDGDILASRPFSQPALYGNTRRVASKAFWVGVFLLNPARSSNLCFLPPVRPHFPRAPFRGLDLIRAYRHHNAFTTTPQMSSKYLQPCSHLCTIPNAWAKYSQGRGALK
jgi:hypothetical protein